MNPAQAGRLGGLASRGFGRAKHLRSLHGYEAMPKSRLYCKTQLPYEKRRNNYCSHSCASKVANGNRPLKLRSCLGCHVSWHRSRTTRSDYCPKCRRPDLRFRPLEGCQTDRSRKNALLREMGHACAVCRGKRWCAKPIPLELEHIDGNSENNSRPNLRLICPNCHAQTLTYKGRNRGKGRFSRLQRYREGKSY